MRVQANFLPILQCGYHLGGGAVESSPDHLQAGDVLGMDSGAGLHTQALQVPISFFRVADLGDHSRQEQQPQEQQPRAGPGAGGAGARSQAHVAEVPTGEQNTRAIRAGALQTSGSKTLQPRFYPHCLSRPEAWGGG